MLTVPGQHHQRAGTDRLCVLRKEGGRGGTQIEGDCITEVMKFMECV